MGNPRDWRACVDWFNVTDSEFGNVIETEERDDICAVLEELAFVARQRHRCRRVTNGGIGNAIRVGGMKSEGQMKGLTLQLDRSIVFTSVFRRSNNVRPLGYNVRSSVNLLPNNHFLHISGQR